MLVIVKISSFEIPSFLEKVLLRAILSCNDFILSLISDFLASTNDKCAKSLKMTSFRKVAICESLEEMKAFISSGSSVDGSDSKSSDKISKSLRCFNSSFILIELRIHSFVSESVSESLIKISIVQTKKAL